MTNRVTCIATLAAVVSLAVSAPLASGAQPGRRADTVVADAALARGDCRAAAEAYVRAAESAREAALAERATAVAAHCEHWPARARRCALADSRARGSGCDTGRGTRCTRPAPPRGRSGNPA